MKHAPKSTWGFEKMGLIWPIVKAIHYKGYKSPTPIQRKVIPLILNGKNLIATSRTGSGKTAAFLLPLLNLVFNNKTQKIIEGGLGSSIKAIILSPTRELALQTYKFAKEFSKFCSLNIEVILGGDSMEKQFSLFHATPNPDDSTSTNNNNKFLNSNLPDIIIATPGRLCHLFMEMGIGALTNCQYLVLDEADRLLEMGFAPQLSAIVSNHLPKPIQTLLFSATLSSNMTSYFLDQANDASMHNGGATESQSIFNHWTDMEEFVFAKCHAEYKMSPDLSLQFIACKGDNTISSTPFTNDKLDALLYLIDQLIVQPSYNMTKINKDKTVEPSESIFPNRLQLQKEVTNHTKPTISHDKKEKLTSFNTIRNNTNTTIGKTLIFLPTKYHVDYVKELLACKLGLNVCYVYSSLDASARKSMIARFRGETTLRNSAENSHHHYYNSNDKNYNGMHERIDSQIMLVTDIAARGLDIPFLDNVINFCFPATPKLFIHRIGRVARAGKPGTAYSLICHKELPHLLDFMNYIGHDLIFLRAGVPFDQRKISQQRNEENNTRPFEVFGKVPDDLKAGIHSSDLGSQNKDLLTPNSELSNSLVSLAQVCDRAIAKFTRSQTKPSKASILRVKTEFLKSGGILTLKPHPLFLTLCSNEKAETLDANFEYLERIKNYKNQDLVNRTFLKKLGNTASNASADNSKTSKNNRLLAASQNKTGSGRTVNNRFIGQTFDREDYIQKLEEKLGPNASIKKSAKLFHQLSQTNTNNNLLVSRFADNKCFIPYGPPQDTDYNEKSTDQGDIFNAEMDILDFNEDDGNLIRSKDSKSTGTTKKRLVWDPKRKRFVNPNDLLGRKKAKSISTPFYNESGVKIKDAYKTRVYAEWLKKTHGGTIRDSVAGSALSLQNNDDVSDDENTGNKTHLSNNNNCLGQDWRFKKSKLRQQSFNNNIKDGRMSIGNRKNIKTIKKQKVNMRALGLKPTEKAFKLKYRKEEKQAFEASRRKEKAPRRKKQH